MPLQHGSRRLSSPATRLSDVGTKMRLDLTCGEALDVVSALPLGSVPAIITDPPYGNTDLAFDQEPVDWVRLWPELRRVLTPTGLLVMFAGDLFTLDMVAAARDIYRYRLVWEKTRSTGFFDANQRPQIRQP